MCKFSFSAAENFINKLIQILTVITFPKNNLKENDDSFSATPVKKQKKQYLKIICHEAFLDIGQVLVLQMC